MITIYSNSNQVSYGIKHYNLDTIDDLKNLDKNRLNPGSTIFIISSSKYYMLNGKKSWIEINPYGMGSSNSNSGGSGDSGGDSNENYDGGSIDGSDPTI